MRKYSDCPTVVREFLSYHETIKAQSPRTIADLVIVAPSADLLGFSEVGSD